MGDQNELEDPVSPVSPTRLCSPYLVWTVRECSNLPTPCLRHPPRLTQNKTVRRRARQPPNGLSRSPLIVFSGNTPLRSSNAILTPPAHGSVELLGEFKTRGSLPGMSAYKSPPSSLDPTSPDFSEKMKETYARVVEVFFCVEEIVCKLEAESVHSDKQEVLVVFD